MRQKPKNTTTQNYLN